MTRDEVNAIFAESDLSIEQRRRLREEREKAREQPPEHGRNLTDGEMLRWRQYFDQRLVDERAFIMAVVAEALAEYKRETIDEIETKMAAAELAKIREEAKTAATDLAKIRKEIDDEQTKQRAIANAEVTPLPLRLKTAPPPIPATKRA